MGGAGFINSQNKIDKNSITSNRLQKDENFYCNKDRESYKLPPEVLENIIPFLKTQNWRNLI